MNANPCSAQRSSWRCKRRALHAAAHPQTRPTAAHAPGTCRDGEVTASTPGKHGAQHGTPRRVASARYAAEASRRTSTAALRDESTERSVNQGETKPAIAYVDGELGVAWDDGWGDCAAVMLRCS
jgi:hypothetical protein